MNNTRIARGDSFKLWAAIGSSLVFATVAGAALGLANATGTSSAAAVTLDTVKGALPELEKLVKDTLRKPGVPGIAIAVVIPGSDRLCQGVRRTRSGQVRPGGCRYCVSARIRIQTARLDGDRRVS